MTVTSASTVAEGQLAGKVPSQYPLHRPEFLAEIQRGEEKISALMRGRTYTFRSGTELIAADCEHPYVYRVLSGWVARTRALEDGRSQFILVFIPGDLFAVKSMLMNRHPDAVRALCDAVVERVDFRELHKQYVSDADVASRCLWQIMEEERRLHNWVVALGQASAEERLAMLILELRARLSAAGAIAPEGMTFELPLTQPQLGDFLGLTPVHINRMLRSLREARAFAVQDGVVKILTLGRVVRLAHPLLDTYDRANPLYVRALADLDD